jgi:hypothetical protein
MENASDNETIGFLDMLAGDIWQMMERLRDVIDGETDSEEEDDVEDNDPEEYGEYTWKEGLTAEEIAKGDTIDPLTGEPIEK